MRIHKPSLPITLKSFVQGELLYKAEDMESFIIMNRDKTPTQEFATAIDDMLSDISLVVSDEDYLLYAPRDEHIRASLSYDKKIEYASVAALENANVSVRSLLEDGYLPEAILNYLVSLGSSVEIASF